MASILRISGHFMKLTYRNTFVRHLLSTSYGQQSDLNKFFELRKREVCDQSLSSVCLLIDRCSEKQLPISSLTIDKLIHTIKHREDVEASMYYLHKFRHSNECYFLRSWTTHVWISQCVKLDAVDLSLKAIDGNAQYGIFPDCVSYCQLLNYCIRNEDYRHAFKFASHMFCSETLNSKVSQISCLFVVLKLLEKGLAGPQTFSATERRDLAGLCLCLGEHLNLKNLKILGLANLGLIEKKTGVHCVYQDPWRPLMWSEGYLKKAVAEIDATDSPMHQDVLNFILENVENDNALSKSLAHKKLRLEAAGLVNKEPIIKVLRDHFLPHITEAEESDMENFAHTARTWIEEYHQLTDIEKKIQDEKNIQRKEHFKAVSLDKLAKKMAVKKLGYWEFITCENEEKDIDQHLKEDYVNGSSSDIEIEQEKFS